MTKLAYFVIVKYVSLAQIYELAQYKSITRSVCYQSDLEFSSIMKAVILYVCMDDMMI